MKGESKGENNNNNNVREAARIIRKINYFPGLLINFTITPLALSLSESLLVPPGKGGGGGQ